MLLSLQIKNFLLVENLELNFTEGLCIITGETGSGKSIILNSINFILGAKLNNKVIQVNKDRAIVTANFDIRRNYNLIKYLKEIQLFYDEEELNLRRSIDIDNRSKIYLNDKIINIKTLKNISSFLVEVHGQNQQSILVNNKIHKYILDEFGEYDDLLLKVSQTYKEWHNIENNIESVLAKINAVKSEHDYISYAINEIEAINPEIGEENHLTIKRIELQNKDKSIQILNSAILELTKTNEIEKSLINLSRIISKSNIYNNEEYNNLYEVVERVSIDLFEIVKILENKKSDLLDEDEDIENIEKRLFLIKSISRKYNKSSDELKDYLSELRCKMDKSIEYEKTLKKLNSDRIISRKKYLDYATKLSNQRLEYSNKLETNIQNELNYLKMSKARFRVEFNKLDESKWDRAGLEDIKFKASINPGQDFSEISETASGGELSRLMLAIKVVLSKKKSNIMLIFDEIDSGIGGEVADLIANRLNILSKDNQILLITHQAQIAAKAVTHLLVTKEQFENHTETIVTKITGEDIYKELARMLAGSNISPEVIEVAKQLTSL